MIKDLGALVRKEWLCFRGSDRGVFILYLILLLSWSFLIANGTDSPVNTGALWFIFFSVVITANFSNTVFISERVSGSLEILITSGFSRGGILFGKMIFVLLMSLAIGAACIGLGALWHSLIPEFYNRASGLGDFLVFATSSFMNIACSAFLSVRMSNPRLLHFANLFLLGLIIGAHSVLTQYFFLPDFVLPVILIFTGSIFTWLAYREFQGEKILQPVIF
ncbi:MAG: ABC transporter permease subunit [Fibrobacter sp.]|nr:ABC transporter permease subunit [Fibrobacter sp.]